MHELLNPPIFIVSEDPRAKVLAEQLSGPDLPYVFVIPLVGEIGKFLTNLKEGGTQVDAFRLNNPIIIFDSSSDRAVVQDNPPKETAKTRKAAIAKFQKIYRAAFIGFNFSKTNQTSIEAPNNPVTSLKELIALTIQRRLQILPDQLETTKGAQAYRSEGWHNKTYVVEALLRQVRKDTLIIDPHFIALLERSDREELQLILFLIHSGTSLQEQTAAIMNFAIHTALGYEENKTKIEKAFPLEVKNKILAQASEQPDNLSNQDRIKFLISISRLTYQSRSFKVKS